MCERGNPDKAIQKSIPSRRNVVREISRTRGHESIQFADKLGWTHSRLNELMKGKRGITTDSVLGLAKAFGPSAKVWMNPQATYDLAQAMKHRKTA